MVTLSILDFVALAAALLTLLLLFDRQSLLREMKRTRREVKALHLALEAQGKPTRRGTIPPWLRQKVIERCEYQCQYCGGFGDAALGPDGLAWHVDHVIPVSKGGPTHEGNLTLSCEACNLAKSKKHSAEFNFQDACAVMSVAAPHEDSVPTPQDLVSEVLSVPLNSPPSNETEQQRIWETWQRTGSLKAAERELYGQTGGIKFYWVRAAVEEMERRRGRTLQDEGEA